MGDSPFAGAEVAALPPKQLQPSRISNSLLAELDRLLAQVSSRASATAMVSPSRLHLSVPPLPRCWPPLLHQPAARALPRSVPSQFCGKPGAEVEATYNSHQ